MTDRDPIAVWRGVLGVDHGVSDEELDQLDAEVQAHLDEAVTAAEVMPLSDPAGLTRFVYPEATR